MSDKLTRATEAVSVESIDQSEIASPADPDGRAILAPPKGLGEYFRYELHETTFIMPDDESVAAPKNRWLSLNEIRDLYLVVRAANSGAVPVQGVCSAWDGGKRFCLRRREHAGRHIAVASTREGPNVYEIVGIWGWSGK